MIVIRPLFTLDEMQAAADLQRVYWGDDAESAIPAHMLYSLANFGGHVIAALDDGRIVGVIIGFLGTDMNESHRPALAKLQIVSKRMVVLPDYRNQGIGYRLKLAQRDFAIEQGVRLITWTFDPMLAANAHLNIRKLGGVSHRYKQNYYGTNGTGNLSVLGYSDRLLVDWWVTNRRVEERINTNRGFLGLAQYLDAGATILNPSSAQTDGTPWPAEDLPKPRGTFILVEIPLVYMSIVHTDEVLARAWRENIRYAFDQLLMRGYMVTDFIREKYEGRDRAFYALSIADVSQN